MRVVQHRREGALPALFLQNPRHVLVGVARVDHERQTCRTRRSDVSAKAAFLRVARAQIIMVIEPSFADRHDLGVARARDQFADINVALFIVGFVVVK